jgi:hypothetical protein
MAVLIALLSTARLARPTRRSETLTTEMPLTGSSGYSR